LQERKRGHLRIAPENRAAYPKPRSRELRALDLDQNNLVHLHERTGESLAANLGFPFSRMPRKRDAALCLRQIWRGTRFRLEVRAPATVTQVRRGRPEELAPENNPFRAVNGSRTPGAILKWIFAFRCGVSGGKLYTRTNHSARRALESVSEPVE
jgi:hypothetical protein